MRFDLSYKRKQRFRSLKTDCLENRVKLHFYVCTGKNWDFLETMIQTTIFASWSGLNSQYVSFSGSSHPYDVTFFPTQTTFLQITWFLWCMLTVNEFFSNIFYGISFSNSILFQCSPVSFYVQFTFSWFQSLSKQSIESFFFLNIAITFLKKKRLGRAV